MANPWVIALLVALASFMEVLDTTIANVALPYIAGGMGVSQDEASWVVTTYLVSNAIILTASSFLARMLGRKNFFLICLGVFTLSSLLCGFAPNLNALLLCRILQGFGGGGMVPVAQSILADSFPPAKRGQAFAVFGVAVVVAPVVGPTLGGWLSDNVSWHWCFLINVPVGVIAMTLIALLLRESPTARAEAQQQRGKRFDVVGFVLVATFLGALEVVLDRGLEDDWFGSTLHRDVHGHLHPCVCPDDSVGVEPPLPDHRPAHGSDAPVRRLLPGNAGDWRDPARDHAIPAATGAAGLRLHCHLGRPRALAGRRCHDDDDVRGRPFGSQGAAQISDRRRRGDLRAFHVRP